MRIGAVLGILIAVLPLTGCNDKKIAEIPPPHELTASAIGHYCGMTLVEHAGPKGQIILASRREPVWFSSVRDAFSFTMLPEEPKDIRAIYVSDMANAASWDHPGTTNWINAKKGFFVVASRVKGGMGADEAVPFSDRTAAERFAAENGGRVITFDEVPRDYVLGASATTSSVEPSPSKHDPGASKQGHAH